MSDMEWAKQLGPSLAYGMDVLGKQVRVQMYYEDGNCMVPFRGLIISYSVTIHPKTRASLTRHGVIFEGGVQWELDLKELMENDHLEWLDDEEDSMSFWNLYQQHSNEAHCDIDEGNVAGNDGEQDEPQEEYLPAAASKQTAGRDKTSSTRSRRSSKKAQHYQKDEEKETKSMEDGSQAVEVNQDVLTKPIRSSRSKGRSTRLSMEHGGDDSSPKSPVRKKKRRSKHASPSKTSLSSRPRKIRKQTNTASSKRPPVVNLSSPQEWLPAFEAWLTAQGECEPAHVLNLTEKLVAGVGWNCRGPPSNMEPLFGRELMGDLEATDLIKALERLGTVEEEFGIDGSPLSVVLQNMQAFKQEQQQIASKGQSFSFENVELTAAHKWFPAFEKWLTSQSLSSQSINESKAKVHRLIEGHGFTSSKVPMEENPILVFMRFENLADTDILAAIAHVQGFEQKYGFAATDELETLHMLQSFKMECQAHHAAGVTADGSLVDSNVGDTAAESPARLPPTRLVDFSCSASWLPAFMTWASRRYNLSTATLGKLDGISIKLIQGDGYATKKVPPTESPILHGTAFEDLNAIDIDGAAAHVHRLQKEYSFHAGNLLSILRKLREFKLEYEAAENTRQDLGT